MESLHHTHNKRPSAAWFSQKTTVAVVLESLPAREKQVGQKCIENLPREVRRARPVLPWLRIPCTSLFGLVCVVAACLQCSWCVGVCAATANQLCWLHRGPALLERGAVLHRKFAERSPPSKARSFLADRSLSQLACNAVGVWEWVLPQKMAFLVAEDALCLKAAKKRSSNSRLSESRTSRANTAALSLSFV